MSQNDTVENLSKEEIEAAGSYASDSRFFHDLFQYREASIPHTIDYIEFMKTGRKKIHLTDSAISKNSLTEDVKLYSGHGNGFNVRGSITGDAKHFIGLKYYYQGYISASLSKDVALNSFLSKSAKTGSSPTLLEFHLPAKFNALDMTLVGAFGEQEYLLGREPRYLIFDAETIPLPESNEGILHLKLKPDFQGVLQGK